MSLDSNDPSSWQLAATTHGELAMTQSPNYFELGYSRLRPLGRYARIKEFIEDRVHTAEFRQGDLPTVYEVPVTGSKTPLVLPMVGLSAEATLTFERAAERGVEEVARVMHSFEGLQQEARRIEEREEELEGMGLNEEEIRDRIREENAGKEAPSDAEIRNMLESYYEEEGLSGSERDAAIDRDLTQVQREGKGNESGVTTSLQRYSAIAVTAGSCIDSILGIATDPGELPIDVASNALGMVASICSTIGSLTSSTIVGTVFQILAAICNVISSILAYFRGYTVHPHDGVNSKWSAADRHRILRSRLVVLVQCDAGGCVPGRLDEWWEAWEKAMDGREPDERTRVLASMVVGTALGQGEERYGTAQSICQMMGGTGNSYRMCQEIRDWLMFIGVPERDAKVVFAWLTESRKVTATIAHRVKLGQEMDFTGSSVWWRDENDIDDDGSECYHGNCRCGSSKRRHDSRPNMYWGTDSSRNFNNPPGWYEACRNLPEHDKFTQQDLERLRDWLMDRIGVVPVAPKGSPQTFRVGSMPSGHVSDVLRPDWPNQTINLRVPTGISSRGKAHWLLVTMSPGLTPRDIYIKGEGAPIADPRGGPTDNFYRLQKGDVSWGVWYRYTYEGAELDKNTGEPFEFRVGDGSRGGVFAALHSFAEAPEFKAELKSRLPSPGLGAAGAAVGIGAAAAVAAAIYFLPK